MPELQVPPHSDERVVLRGWRLDDAEALRPACGDAAICRFTSVPRAYTPEAAQAWIGRQHAHARRGTAIVWAVIPPGQDQPVGMVGLFGLGELEPSARFGYWLVAGWRGRGLIAAATSWVAEWGFTQLQLTEIHIDREPANQASARVAERLGAVARGARQVAYDELEIELVRHTLSAPGRR